MKNNTATHSRTRNGSNLSAARTMLTGVKNTVLSGARTRITAGTKKVKAGAKAADAVIRRNPYRTAAIAAGVGVALGVLAGRRSKRSS